uniref:hypothetical protein n=1 Tax=Bacillus pumilus TaxID=1408 RepID=UPI0011A928B1
MCKIWLKEVWDKEMGFGDLRRILEEWMRMKGVSEEKWMKLKMDSFVFARVFQVVIHRDSLAGGHGIFFE